MSSSPSSNGQFNFMNVSKYGIASVMGAYLIWQVSAYIPEIFSLLQKVESKVDNVTIQHMDIKSFLRDESIEKSKRDDMMIKLLRANCLNTSETREERVLCNQ